MSDTITLKAVSMWQPWASLLVHGKKRIETRSWSIPLKLPCVLAIHATATIRPEVRELVMSFATDDGGHFREALAEIHGMTREESYLDRLLDLPLGAVVGLVRVVDCLRTGPGLRLHPNLDERERAFGDYRDGRYAWICDQAVAFHWPVPCKGKQKLWDWQVPEELCVTGEDIDRLSELLELAKGVAT